MSGSMDGYFDGPSFRDIARARREVAQRLYRNRLSELANAGVRKAGRDVNIQYSKLDIPQNEVIAEFAEKELKDCENRKKRIRAELDSVIEKNAQIKRLSVEAGAFAYNHDDQSSLDTANSKISQALEIGAQLESKYTTLEYKIAALSRDIDHLQVIAEQRQKSSSNVLSELESLSKQADALDHEKFSPGTLAGLKNEIAALNPEKYEDLNAKGPDLVAQLGKLVAQIKQAEQDFMESRNDAMSLLSQAQEEFAGINPDELGVWAQSPEEAGAAVAQLGRAAEFIEREEFAESVALTAQAAGTLRKLQAVATENQNKVADRNDIAEAVMNALYEQGYDAPTFYYAEQQPDGSDRELSNLTIFAKAPGNRGDMRLNIDLEGKVRMKIEGIPEGEEAECHQIIENLQAGLQGGLQLNMTDWGRAEGKSSGDKVVIREKKQEKEKQKDRYNG